MRPRDLIRDALRQANADAGHDLVLRILLLAAVQMEAAELRWHHEFASAIGGEAMRETRAFVMNEVHLRQSEAPCPHPHTKCTSCRQLICSPREQSDRCEGSARGAGGQGHCSKCY